MVIHFNCVLQRGPVPKQVLPSNCWARTKSSWSILSCICSAFYLESGPSEPSWARIGKGIPDPKGAQGQAHINSNPWKACVQKIFISKNPRPQLYVLVPKLVFWGDFMIVRYHFSAREFKNTLKPWKNVVWRPKTTFFVKMHLKKGMFSWRVSLEGFTGGIPCFISCEKCWSTNLID